MTVGVPSGALTTALAGITRVAFAVCAVSNGCTLVTGFSACLGFLASNQTSTVVLLGSSAGLTTVTLPSIGSSIPGTDMVPLSPTFSVAASFCGMCALAINEEVSITVIRGVPAAAISPG